MMKMIKTSVFIYLWISCFHFSLYAVDTNLEITFFKVGQGSCSLATFKKGPAILIDAGSSQIPGCSKEEQNSFKSETITEIVNKINKPSNRRQWRIDLYVIISHGDIDHYNWVQHIVAGLPVSNSWNIKFLLGGKESDYSSSFQEFIRPYRNENCKKAYYVNPDYQNNVSSFAVQLYESTCEILSALSSSDKNTNSLVVKIQENRNNGLSVMLTGDATKDTIEYITHTYSLHHLHVKILQASHHGADSDGSNAIEWFQTINPYYVVINAGDRIDYLHPRNSTLINALSSLNLVHNTERHILQYGCNKRIFSNYHQMSDAQNYYPETFFRLDNNYLISMTDRGIFSTHNQGNITFSSKRTEAAPRINYTQKPLDTSLFGCFKYTLSQRHLREHTIGIFLPNQFIINNPSEFFYLLTQFNTLISCDFNNVNYNVNITKDMIDIFLKKHLSLINFIFFDNTPQEVKESIKILWDHRGLSI